MQDRGQLQPAEPGESLRKRFELTQAREIVGGHAYELLRPRNIDDLISEEDFAIDERIPYWAECWPSARVLAERIARHGGQGRTLLELGCGIGLLSIAAARAGFEVLATDYYADALEFVATNAELNGVPTIDTRLVDWRRLPDDLGVFDVVLASDVLYEEPQAALIAGAFARTLSAAGVGLLSDPGRRTAGQFVAECRKVGLIATCVEQKRTVDARAELTVSIYEIRRSPDDHAGV